MRKSGKSVKKKSRAKLSKRSSSSRTFWLISLGFLVLFLPIFVLSLQKPQDVNRQASAAGDLYVSCSGSDSNSGTQSSPFATINKAASAATAGTTIHVQGGACNYQPVINDKSGTASSPITFISEPKFTANPQSAAKIVGSGNGTTKGYLFRNNGSYVHVIGFDMSGKGVTDGLDNFGSNNLIQGNHIHAMTNINCSGTPGGSGLGDDTGSNNTYDGNMVDHIGDYPTKCDYVHGIYVDDAGDIVSNNIAFNNVGNGLYTNHGSGGGVTFINNTSFANLEYGVGVNGSVANSIVANNILMGNGIAGVKLWSGVSGTQITNNIIYNNPTAVTGGTAQNSISVDPQFVNYQADGTGDYHLKAGSPAIDKGTATNAPKIDYDGHPRPQGNGVDIGAYESGSAGSISQTPSIPPTSVVPTFVCGGSQNCVGTPAPTSPITTSLAPSIVAPSNTISNSPTIAVSLNPSLSLSPITGGNQQDLVSLLLNLLAKILQLFEQLLGNSHGGHSSHGHHHH
jgi:hypothetical protein